MKVSAVIPAYNAARYIADALESVHRQTRPVDEIIVANDASTDDTVETIQRWSQDRGREVSIVELRENGGAGAARTAGFRAARHEMVAMLDADDRWYPEMVELLAGALEKDHSLAAAFGYREFVTPDGPTGHYQGQERLERILDQHQPEAPVYLSTKQAFLLNLESGVTSCSAAVAMREGAMNAGLFDQTLRTSQDREFFLRLSRQGPFLFVPRAVGFYRLHDTNTTHARNALKTTRNALAVLLKLERLQNDLDLDDDERAALREALQSCVDRVLYAASQRGLRPFLDANAHVRDVTTNVRPRQFHLWARALWRSILPDPTFH